MQKVKQSILAPAILEARVIPNGVDLSIFRPADKQAVRAALGLPQDARILLFSANGIRRNIWKDYQTLRTAVALVADELKMSNILFIALGEDAPPEQIGQAVAQFVPYQKDPVMVARYYQTADLYIHAARADTFPNTVLEALACGTPVVATAVGGIPEQVKGLRLTPVTGKPIAPEFNAYTPEEATGILVRQGDAIAMAEAIITLLKDKELRQRLGENAARDARERFDLDRQVEVYLSWYKDLVLQRLTSES
jgi:glycosyltransferase involved in cell wall biosynthesis